MMHATFDANRSYAEMGKQSRVLSANSHQLVEILLEELLNLLDEICLIQSADPERSCVDHKYMALSILDSLMVSLDNERGGALARNLHVIYSQVRKLVDQDNADLNLQNGRAAREIISEIQSAWMQIG